MNSMEERERKGSETGRVAYTKRISSYVYIFVLAANSGCRARRIDQTRDNL